MNNRKIRLGIAFVCLLLLAGCNKDILPEEQQPDISDNIVADVPEPGTEENSMTETPEPEAEENSETEEAPENTENTTIYDTIQEEIMNWDFARVEFPEYWEEMGRSYSSRADLEDVEWRLIDLNGDGIEDLILQEKEVYLYSEYHPTIDWHRIIAIIACEESDAKCILWGEENIDYGFFFCSPTGALMHYYYLTAHMIDQKIYDQYYFDEDWNQIQAVHMLRHTEYLNNTEEDRMEHPDAPEEAFHHGYYTLYYVEYAGSEWTQITFDEFKEVFEEITGIEYVYSS